MAISIFKTGMLEEDADAANMKFDVQLIEYEAIQIG